MRQNQNFKTFSRIQIVGGLVELLVNLLLIDFKHFLKFHFYFIFYILVHSFTSLCATAFFLEFIFFLILYLSSLFELQENFSRN